MRGSSPGVQDKLKGTVIRAGFGMFVRAPITIASLAVTGAYSTTPILAQEGFSQSTAMTVTNNNYVSPAATLGNPFPNGISPADGIGAVGSGDLQRSDDQLHQSGDEESVLLCGGTLSIQRELGKNTLLEVAYIANHSVHIPVTVTQVNGIPRQFLSTLPIRDAAVNTALTATVTNPFVDLLPNSSNLNGSTTALANLLPRFPQFPVGDGSGGWSMDRRAAFWNSSRTRAAHTTGASMCAWNGGSRKVCPPSRIMDGRG